MTKQFRAITIWQPYASLLAWGEKRYETRSWEPSPNQLRPGDIVMIHAAKRKPQTYERQLATTATLAAILKAHHETLDTLPYGAIVAAARFIDVHPTDGLNVTGTKEKLFGNWKPGRYAWEFEIVKLPETPIITQGKQGLWWWEAESA